MAINSDNYVRIVSAVAGAEVLPTQAMHLRRFTTNPLVPVGKVLEMDRDSVAAYFGADSMEARDARVYFGYVTKAPASSPSRIQFAPWINSDRAPAVYGQKTAPLSEITAVATGSLTITLAGVTATVSALDFTSDATFADVASTIQTALNALSQPQFASASVIFDAIKSSFVITGAAAQAGDVSVSAGPTATLLGLVGTSVVYSGGELQESTLDAYQKALSISDNFGPASILFPSMYTPNLANDVIPLAQFVNAENGSHRMDWAVPESVRATWMPAVQNIGYNSWNHVTENNPVELLPSAITAATNFSLTNGIQGYMYQQGGNLNATVFDDLMRTEFVAQKLNFVGRTMSSGQPLDFYQEGDLTGVATDPASIGVQANEMWLRARAKAALLNLQMTVPLITSDIDGEAMIYATLVGTSDGSRANGPIAEALRNGVISVGKSFNSVQDAAIYAITGDPLAAQQVKTSGWWLDVKAQGNVANYVLVYATAEQVRRIVGSHNLI